MTELWDKFIFFIESILEAIPLMLSDVFIGLFDSLMSVVNGLLEGLSFGLEYLDITNYINGIPVEVTNVMGLIGVTQVSTMIVTSLGIRLILQLIPFTRLGS